MNGVDTITVDGRGLKVDVVREDGRLWLRLEWPGDEIGRSPTDEDWAAAEEEAYAEIDWDSEGLSEPGFEYRPIRGYGWIVESEAGSWWHLDAETEDEAREQAAAMLEDKGMDGLLYRTYDVACGAPLHTPKCGHSVPVERIHV